MNYLLLNVLLAISWSALTGSFEPVDLLFGFGLGYLILWVIARMTKPDRYFKQFPLTIELLIFFLADLVRANIRLAMTVLSPRMNLRPAVIAVPLILVKDTSIILLANLLTLTPGTLSLDISTDRNTLYIHTVWLDSKEKLHQQIVEGYEQRLKVLLES